MAPKQNDSDGLRMSFFGPQPKDIQLTVIEEYASRKKILTVVHATPGLNV